ncbi:MAG: hypothetical protein K2N64_00100 [Anaeroplasmataceae bacterium]|nr:hypothetical protein [Anaeroplasmataceae bacterium]
MRINPKVFAVANQSEPVDVQEFDGRKVEVFMMDEYPQVKEEFLNKGKFAVWSSVDGVNYRVFIESGYYEELKPLYAQAINKIWVDFWDACETISRKMTRFVIIPITILAIGGCIGFSFLPQGSIYAMIAVVVLAFGALMFCNRYSRKKIYDANAASVELIKKSLGGTKEFDDLLDRQKNYMDQYYDNLYPEEDEDLEENSEIVESLPAEDLPEKEQADEAVEHKVEAEIIEAKDNE